MLKFDGLLCSGSDFLLEVVARTKRLRAPVSKIHAWESPRTPDSERSRVWRSPWRVTAPLSSEVLVVSQSGASHAALKPITSVDKTTFRCVRGFT